jgi:DnaJ-class molecular chaperone
VHSVTMPTKGVMCGHEKPKTNPAETKCQDCDGKGVLAAVQPSPGRRIYGPRCQSCEGSGRIKRT